MDDPSTPRRTIVIVSARRGPLYMDRIEEIVMTRRRRPRRAGGTLKDGERRQLARASRTPAPAPASPGRDRVHCDGGSRGNPGPAAIAAVLLTPTGAVARRHATRIGRATAAEAEYRAILLGLALAAERGLNAIEVCSDSKLAIAALQGSEPADPALTRLVERIRAAARAFEDITWTWHSRAENGAADELVRELLWGLARRPGRA
jgi:ribonuclease HI